MFLIDGKEYARVSEILKPFSNLSHIDPQVVERKALIGTQVHEAIASHILGDFPVLSKESVGYFNSFEAWAERIGVSFHQSERRYKCDDKRITGQIDALVQMPGNKNLTLVDFKTSSQENSISWPMQAHLYHYLLNQNDCPVDSTFLFIKLDKEGRLPKVHSYKFDLNISAKCMKAIDDFWKMIKDDSK